MEIFCISKKVASAKPVQILSGEKLIDNIEFRNQLLKQFPEAAGGEMEAAGLAAAAHQKNKEWVVIKSICDFADGKKGFRKKAQQKKAAAAAVSFCEFVLSQNESLDALGCIPLSAASKNNHKQPNCDSALFEIYVEDNEYAYLEREIDLKLKTNLTRHGYWLSGPSGSGKTTALRRIVILEKYKCTSLDLSQCVGGSVLHVFATMCAEISDALGAPPLQQQPTVQDFAFWIKRTVESIAAHANPNTYFLIDEIPIDDSTDFQQFANSVSAILIGLANKNIHSTKLLLASIANPKSQLKAFQKKVQHQIRFIELPMWTPAEIETLLVKLNKLLKLKLKSVEKSKIIQAANGCPRRLKHILKIVYSHRNSPEWPLERIFEETSC